MFFRYRTASASCSFTTALIVLVVCVLPLGAGQVDELHEALLGTWVPSSS